MIQIAMQPVIIRTSPARREVKEVIFTYPNMVDTGNRNRYNGVGDPLHKMQMFLFKVSSC